MNQADTAEFAEFYSAHFHRIAGQLHAYLGDHTEAQDIAQEAFCRALDRWSTVRTYAEAPAWVRRVAWNLATSRLRHLQVAVRHVTRQRVEHIEGPGPDRVALTHALATLPPNHRLAVVLHHLGHLTVAEIAEQQGVAEGTVRSWLSRGRSQLAEYFVEKEEPEWKAMATRAFQPDGVEATASTVRRRRITRRSMLAAALVLALAIPWTIIVRIRGGEAPIIGPTVPPTIPSPSVSGSPQIVLPSPRRTAPPLSPAIFELPAFPYEPTWVPPNAGKARVMVDDTGVSLVYSPDQGTLTVSVGPKGFPLPWVFEHEVDTTVNGLSAKLRTGGTTGTPWSMLSWHQNGQWVTAHGELVPTDDVKRLAEGLQPGRISPTTPFRLVRAPEDWVVSALIGGESGSLTNIRGGGRPAKIIDGPDVAREHYGLCLASSAMKYAAYESICLNLDSFDRFSPDRSGLRQTKIGGNDAWVRDDPITGASVYVHLGTKVLSIAQGVTEQLDETELIRFAEGVTIVGP
ncbi:MAG TPA: hypothetical protein DGG94_12685 [Micromonosporaceae bacterium]|nr:hypothetical protein [Micromonosporaceae bacterium]HCU50635.1 hypothetical protein [Micromonosporaceae bacterium]